MLDFGAAEEQSHTIDPVMSRSVSMPADGAVYPAFPLVSGLDEPTVPSFRGKESHSVVHTSGNEDSERAERECGALRLYHPNSCIHRME